MVYIQDQNSQTPSLANTPVPMTPPGTRFTFPLQDIEYEARDMDEGGGREITGHGGLSINYISIKVHI